MLCVFTESAPEAVLSPQVGIQIIHLTSPAASLLWNHSSTGVYLLANTFYHARDHCPKQTVTDLHNALENMQEKMYGLFPHIGP